MPGSSMLQCLRSHPDRPRHTHRSVPLWSCCAARQVQSGSPLNSTLLGIYRFWRSQAPMDKPHAPVDDRMLPAILAASDSRASVGP